MANIIDDVIYKVNSIVPFNTLCIVSCILLFILVVNAMQIRYIETALLNGFWKANSDYCKDAGIKSMLLYLDINGVDVLYKRIPAYILIENNEGVIINNPVKIRLNSLFDLSQTLTSCRKYKMNIDWLETTDYEMFFPSNQILYYYPKCGKIVLTGYGDNIYAVLFKDNSMTEILQHNQSNEESNSVSYDLPKINVSKVMNKFKSAMKKEKKIENENSEQNNNSEEI